MLDFLLVDSSADDLIQDDRRQDHDTDDRILVDRGYTDLSESAS